jgi:hypothetical protein
MVSGFTAEERSSSDEHTLRRSSAVPMVGAIEVLSVSVHFTAHPQACSYAGGAG